MMRPLCALYLIAVTMLASCSAPAQTETRVVSVARSQPQPKICSLHHVKMEREAVMVVFGEPDVRSPYHLASQQHFPNANMVAFSSVGAGDSQLIEFCPKCRSARDAWLMKHSGQKRVLKGD